MPNWSFHLDKYLYNRAATIAKKEKRNRSQFFRYVLEKYCDEYENV